MRYRTTLSRRLILYFLIVMLIPFIIFISFYLISGENTLRRILDEQAEMLIEQDAAFLRSVVEEYRHKSYLVTTNERVIKALSGAVQPIGDDARTMYAELYSIMSGDTYRASLSVVSKDGSVRLSTHEFPEKYDTRTHSNEWDESNIIALSERSANKNKQWFISITDHRIENGHQIAFSLLRRISDIGYAIIDVYIDTISPGLGSSGFFSDIIVIDNSIYQAYSLIHTQNYGEFSLFPALRNSENLTVRAIPGTEMVIVGVMSMENAEIGLKSTMFYLILSLGVGISVSMLLTFVFSRSISKRFSLLSSGMRRFERGDFNTKLESTGIYEFDRLSLAFNVMVSRIENLISRQREEEAKSAEAERKALESQLNPHFLFNTLSTIKALARLHGEDEIYTIALRLGKLLRYSIDNHSSTSTVKESLDLTESYLMIQKIRFGERLKYEIHCPESLYSVNIPRLIIQPLAENSVTHGLESKTGSWEITITVENADNDIAIKVIDNGLGFDTSRLSEDFVNEGHTGLYNIRRRLELRYGSAFSFDISSEIGKGTAVSIKLPMGE